jgi:hypothetical protein
MFLYLSGILFKGVQQTKQANCSLDSVCIPVVCAFPRIKEDINFLHAVKIQHVKTQEMPLPGK